MYGQYDSDHPIIVGLSGLAGSGKTSTASAIISMVPNGKIVQWDHIYHAMPLYEFASIKTKTIGDNAESRQLHLIHDLLKELFHSKISYEDMVELAYDIYAMPIEEEGKPRSFLQALGTLLRSYDVDCFSHWVTIRAYQVFRKWRSTCTEDELDNPFIVLVSDLRMLNEIENIRRTPNGLVLRFEASESTRNERLFARDKKYMTADQLSHETEMESTSEQFLSQVDQTINTDDLDIEEQAALTVTTIYESIGLLQKAQRS